MTTTPGYTFASDEAVTAAKLNELGTPTIALTQGDKDGIVTEVQRQLPHGTAAENTFRNPNFDVWTAGTSAQTSAVGVRQFRADYWWTRLASTSADLVTCERAASTLQDYLYAAKLTGATGAGIVDFGQEIQPARAAALTPSLTVTFTLYNNTAVALVPVVRIDSCDVSGVFSAVTNRASATGTSIANGATSTQSLTLDTSDGTTAAALRNGALLYLRLASGALDGNTKSVTLMALKAEPGALATRREVDLASVNLQDQPWGASLDLTITPHATPGHFNLYAGSVIFRAAPRTLPLRTLLVEINGTTTGATALDTGALATGAYHVWALANADTIDAVISLSDSAPVIPGGYLYKERIGWVYYNGTNFNDTMQRGRSVHYAPRALGGTIQSTASGWQSVLTAGSRSAGYLLPFAPAFASRLRGVATFGITDANDVMLPSNTDVGFAASTAGIAAQIANCALAGGDPTSGKVSFAVALLPGAADFAIFQPTRVTALEFTGFDF